MTKLLCVSAAGVMLAGVMAVGQQPAVELKEGDAAPAFELPGSDGRTHRLADYAGRAVVLAWFPQAFTGG